MLQTVVVDLLDDYVSATGCFYSTVHDSQDFDIGTIALYLERAITLPASQLSLSLDKLYPKNLAYDAKTDYIDVLHSLKIINDLCFNNKVTYKTEDRVTTTCAVDHYFKGLGGVDTDALTMAAKKIIQNHIDNLLLSTECCVQRQARIVAENDIIANSYWQKDLYEYADEPELTTPAHIMYGAALRTHQPSPVSVAVAPEEISFMHSFFSIGAGVVNPPFVSLFKSRIFQIYFVFPKVCKYHRR